MATNNNTNTANNNKQSLLALLQRPNEPLFAAKDAGRLKFELPKSFYTERYAYKGDPVREGDLDEYEAPKVDRIASLRDIPAKPDLSFTQSLTRKEPFSLFGMKNKRIAGQLVKLLMDAPDVDTFTSLAAYVRDRVNVGLFQYALSVAMQHRPDTRNVPLPSVAEMVPDQFVAAAVFTQAREESAQPVERRRPIEIPVSYTASAAEPEQPLAYFREDIGVNMHHWHWHLVYPGAGEDAVVRKDRRGELFYYMHQQVIARYDLARLAAGRPRVRALSNLREPMEEAYHPKLVQSANNAAYPSRMAGTMLSDTKRKESTCRVIDLERYIERIQEAIDRGYAEKPDGTRVDLDATTGIDILGDIVEASSLSPNEEFYGSLHNFGHDLIAYSHDPEGHYLEGYSCMGSVATAMRDPIFYRWHKRIDQVFARFMSTLPPYRPAESFAFANVEVRSVAVRMPARNDAAANELHTFWQRSAIDLAAGLDFGQQGNVLAQFTHLQHEPFEYVVEVQVRGSKKVRGTCRIFMAPKFDEHGAPLRWRDQRTLMIEMDKFTVFLKAGKNVIRQKSSDSSVTVAYERSFRKLDGRAAMDKKELADFEFCGCGWPQHMLLPKGNTEGQQYDLFVMVTNFAQDTVHEEVDKSVACNTTASFCGLKDQKYPDRRTMGFPFDRPHDVASLEEFAALTPNMFAGECTIRFHDTLIDREQKDESDEVFD